MGSRALNKTRFSFRGIRSAAVAASVATVILSITGCGTIPNAKVSYYQAKTQIKIRVTRSVLCAARNLPLVANTVSPSVVHAADFTTEQSIDLGKLGGVLNDPDMKMEFFEDGRLKTINTTQTGNGEAAIKAATTFASALIPLTIDKSKATPDFAAECALVKKLGDGKPLSLTYEGVVNPKQKGPQNIPPSTASAAYANRLKRAIGGICAMAKDVEKPAKPVQYEKNEDDVLIAARQPALLRIGVGTNTQQGGCSSTLWRGRLPVAQMGVVYELPVPQAAAFSKQVFSAEFAESGALLSVQYAIGSGAASALVAAGSLATIAQGETTSAKAAAVKAEADLIAQQQRLLQCQADPKSCK